MPDDDTSNRPQDRPQQPRSPRGDQTTPRPATRVLTAGGRWFWVLPAATFVVGVLLTALVLGLADGGGNDGGAQAGPTTTSTATAPSPSDGASRPGITVTVPGSCLDLADRTQETLALLRKAVAAARDLDAAQLSSIVRDLQAAQDTLEQQSSDCRSSAGVTTST